VIEQPKEEDDQPTGIEEIDNSIPAPETVSGVEDILEMNTENFRSISTVIIFEDKNVADDAIIYLDKDLPYVDAEISCEQIEGTDNYEYVVEWIINEEAVQKLYEQDEQAYSELILEYAEERGVLGM